jgi:uncharacterized cofD-like protein
MKLLKLLYPGMQLKRWVVLFLVGLVLTSLGFTYLFVELYRTVPFPDEAYTLTLQFLPRPVRALLFVLAGALTCAVAVWRFNKSLLDALRPDGRTDVVDAIYRYRSRNRGARVVAIGGGTGLSNLLRGLKQYTSNVTAIVTVADDGGSSGRLRRELGVLPPGDFRNCIVALADAEPLMARLMQHRFSEGSGLEGHSFGNLFIVALQEITGSFEAALRESSRVLAVRGQILPSTLEDVTLCAELEDGRHVAGESSLAKAHAPIRRVYLKPSNPPAYQEAVRAIMEADLIVVGPGSLYTSVLPNLLVDGISRALLASDALKVYCCNVATERGETDHFTVSDHVATLLRHLPRNPFHFVVANDNFSRPIPAELEVTAVPPNGMAQQATDPALVLADVVDEDNPLRHDPEKLAAVLMRLHEEFRHQAAAPERVAVGV